MPYQHWKGTAVTELSKATRYFTCVTAIKTCTKCSALGMAYSHYLCCVQFILYENDFFMCHTIPGQNFERRFCGNVCLLHLIVPSLEGCVRKGIRHKTLPSFLAWILYPHIYYENGDIDSMLLTPASWDKV